jgi:hypothetical protein
MNHIEKSPSNHIGTLNEKSLHADLKWFLSESHDQLEKRVNNYVIDIVRENLLIEIQTSNFAIIRKKLENLVQNNRVCLVYPIVKDKWIRHFDSHMNKADQRRLSPKHGSYLEIFEELIRIPHIVPHPNFMMELFLVQVEEIRKKNDKESWGRKAWNLYDRKLIKVVERKKFNDPKDFLFFIPNNIKKPFTSLELAQCLKKSVRLAQKMSYCLRKMNILSIVGKKGNAYLYDFQ